MKAAKSELAVRCMAGSGGQVALDPKSFHLLNALYLQSTPNVRVLFAGRARFFKGGHKTAGLKLNTQR